MGVFLVTDEGKIFGIPDYDRFNSLKWYQKAWGQINRRYKNRFLDMKPFRGALALLVAYFAMIAIVIIIEHLFSPRR